MKTFSGQFFCASVNDSTEFYFSIATDFGLKRIVYSRRTNAFLYEFEIRRRQFKINFRSYVPDVRVLYTLLFEFETSAVQYS